MRQSRVVVEALPEWLKMAVGAAFCLALPALVGWMLWSTLRGGRGIAQGLAGGPSEACRALGLTLGERGALSGFAEGRFRGRAVRVSWVVGHEHGYDPSHHVTRVAAAITPPLGAGLEAVEGGTAEGIGWPELERRVAVRAADPARARDALGRAARTLWISLGGPGRLTLGDDAVTVALPGVNVDRAGLEAALQRATALAAALSRA